MRRQAHEQADTPAPHRQIRTLTSEATSQSKWQHKHTPPTDAAHRLRHHPPSNTPIMSHPPTNTQTPSAHTPHAQTSQNPSGGLVKRAYSVWTRIRAQRARHHGCVHSTYRCVQTAQHCTSVEYEPQLPKFWQPVQ